MITGRADSGGMVGDSGTVTVTVGADDVFVEPHAASVATVAAPATPNHARRESDLSIASILPAARTA